MRCRCMPQYANETFDYIIDKGTIDAMMCSAHSISDVDKTVQEAHRWVCQKPDMLLWRTDLSPSVIEQWDHKHS